MLAYRPEWPTTIPYRNSVSNLVLFDRENASPVPVVLLFVSKYSPKLEVEMKSTRLTALDGQNIYSRKTYLGGCLEFHDILFFNFFDGSGHFK